MEAYFNQITGSYFVWFKGAAFELTQVGVMPYLGAPPAGTMLLGKVDGSIIYRNLTTGRYGASVGGVQLIFSAGGPTPGDLTGWVQICFS